MDLSGTTRLHGAPPAVMLAKLVNRMKTELGVTGSIGLSHNKFLAKIASDQDKPNGFFVIGQSDTQSFLADKPIGLIWGVGRATQESLEKAGIRTISDLLRWDKLDLTSRFGTTGARLWHLARGQDRRRVMQHTPIKSISNETTLFEDAADRDLLDGHLWRMCEKVSDRAKARELAGRVVILKLKTSKHQIITRRMTLRDATQLADTVYRETRAMLDQIAVGTAYRLIGAGLSDLCPQSQAERSGDLLDPNAEKRMGAERARDAIRKKFGTDAIIKGRALR
jgi:DNA polymerase-4